MYKSKGSFKSTLSERTYELPSTTTGGRKMSFMVDKSRIMFKTPKPPVEIEYKKEEIKYYSHQIIILQYLLIQKF